MTVNSKLSQAGDRVSLPTRFRLPRVPAAFFGIVLGVAGLANSWRAAAAIWPLPPEIAAALNLVAVAIWLVLVVLYTAKWIVDPQAARDEAENAVQCCFIGLAGVATMLVALALLPYSRPAAELIFGLGGTFTVVFALWRTGILWRGGRDPVATTPVLYLPTVAGAFVTATVAGAMGYGDWGQLAFGAGFFSWLAIESVLLNRLLTAPVLAEPFRPTLGIQLAPPAVGSLAYLSVTTGTPDMMAHAMIGYAILQMLLLLRMLPWIARQRFAASYWAFTFGITALSTAVSRMVARGDTGPMHVFAPLLFILANIVVILVAVGTILLLARGKLLPTQTAPTMSAP
ncbi:MULTISPECIES: dicarboxylate transporter/tellurite-resistance protein TehA [unclassified Rhizobium]|uniref:dicarboxylate transporter/tellurite-resistance protein TehA n=1 Tax=unclassified Rhizobium TaxID=2613769 RepID=UPI0016198FCC|nr:MULTISPECIES: dicarboxylate transporter/tellurite-resistance protein TehA [unclassified Rhizobium]MBB3318793.1 tellurite resistance protein [Rhizobium sp. BK181]MCS4094831.1 tellurite resistance protein [Rhizobium sp. BK176]